jgi:hypothetical protein
MQEVVTDFVEPPVDDPGEIGSYGTLPDLDLALSLERRSHPFDLAEQRQYPFEVGPLSIMSENFKGAHP